MSLTRKKINNSLQFCCGCGMDHNSTNSDIINLILSSCSLYEIGDTTNITESDNDKIKKIFEYKNTLQIFNNIDKNKVTLDEFKNACVAYSSIYFTFTNNVYFYFDRCEECTDINNCSFFLKKFSEHFEIDFLKNLHPVFFKSINEYFDCSKYITQDEIKTYVKKFPPNILYLHKYINDEELIKQAIYDISNVIILYLNNSLRNTSDFDAHIMECLDWYIDDFDFVQPNLHSKVLEFYLNYDDE